MTNSLAQGLPQAVDSYVTGWHILLLRNLMVHCLYNKTTFGQKTYIYARFKVSRAVTMETAIFWDMMLW